MQRHNGQHDPLLKFLPFEHFHLAPLRDVTPEAIKEAAQLARTQYRDREPLKLSTALNFIAKSLGFNDGFSGFQQAYAPSLRQFMDKHGLHRRADLVRTAPEMAFVSLQPRQVADRLFLSGRPMPGQLFTGYDMVWFDLNNRYFRNNPWERHPHFALGYLPFETVMEQVAKAEMAQPGTGSLLLEAAVAACQVNIMTADNLLGDQLLWDSGKAEADFAFVPKIYRPRTCSPHQFKQHESEAREVAKLFREWIRMHGHGWVQVLPYNERLVFLQGKDGEYDFLFPRLRDEAFDHNPFAPYLKNGDVPKSNDAYHFKRWLYFHFDGWLEQETHRSEISFYAGGGEPGGYPGAEEVLKRHLEKKGSYSPPTKMAAETTGYVPVRVGGKQLFVSNLISIQQFRQFIQDDKNQSYAGYSRKPERVDLWEPVNQDHEQDLPAAVTWYDANAYAAWINRTTDLPVRLLAAEEFDLIARPILQPDPKLSDADFRGLEHHRLCRFAHPAGPLIEGHPAYLEESVFQALELHYIPESLVWKRTPAGLAFLVSANFGEWLNEHACAVNTLTLSSLCYPNVPPARGRFAGRSTGKYKSKKVGFRLCYLGAAESPS